MCFLVSMIKDRRKFHLGFLRYGYTGKYKLPVISFRNRLEEGEPIFQKKFVVQRNRIFNTTVLIMTGIVVDIVGAFDFCVVKEGNLDDTND